MYRFSLILTLFWIAVSEAETTQNQTDQSLPTLQPDEVAKSYGYIAERHEVTTADGYILTTYRIRNATTYNRYYEPIIVQHGMISNSAQWVLLGPQHSCAFVLADSGLDVWLSNTRGSVYSRKHRTISSDSPEFWEYSWHEHGILDMPATIDYILKTTVHKQLYYTGHSMGTTMFFVMNSVRPEYNQKVRHMFGLAPAVYMSNSLISLSFPPGSALASEMLGRTYLKNRYETDFIKLQLSRNGLCKLVPNGCGQTEKTSLGFPIPDIISAKQLTHYAQLLHLPYTFQMYDYGERNMMKYNAPKPPRYPIDRITTPLSLMYSTSDNCVAVKDVERFSKDVPNAQLYLVPHPLFTHFDFAVSLDAKDLIYAPMIKTVKEYEKNQNWDSRR